MAPNPSEYTGEEIEPGPLPPIGSPLAMRAVELADLERGVRESSVRNRGLEVDRYVAGHDRRFAYLLPPGPNNAGIPWCARFAADAFSRAASQLGLLDPTRGAGDLASAHKWRRWAASAGRLRQAPQPGYVGLILHDDGKTGHVVIVRDLLDAEHVATIEGNHDDRVTTCRRAIAEFAAWVDVG